MGRRTFIGRRSHAGSAAGRCLHSVRQDRARHRPGVMERVVRRRTDKGRPVHSVPVQPYDERDRRIVLWPLKLAWNSVIVAICGALYVLAKAAEALIARDVRRRLRAIAIVPSPLPAVTRAPVHPSCEGLSRKPAEGIVQLMVERKRIVRRIRELQLLLTKKHGSGKFRVSNPNEEN